MARSTITQLHAHKPIYNFTNKKSVVVTTLFSLSDYELYTSSGDLRIDFGLTSYFAELSIMPQFMFKTEEETNRGIKMPKTLDKASRQLAFDFQIRLIRPRGKIAETD